MPLDKALTREKLSLLWRCDEIPELDIRANKYAILSDIHFGNGGPADDLRHNEETLVTAIEHYNHESYSLILLGDIEELWQFELEEIKEQYQNISYKRFRAFGDDRVHRVFGNHDIDWRTLPDPAKNSSAKSLCATEALKMRDGRGQTVILLIHGHQGDKDSDIKAWRSRFFVRLYRWVEPLFKIDHARPATKSRIKKDYEQILYSWAKESKVILICGHSHRAIFASKSYAQRLEEEIKELQEQISANGDNQEKVKELRKKLEEKSKEYKREKKYKRHIDPTDPGREPLPCYFNTGCALYPGGITAIEIADDRIRLVKWHKDTKMKPRFEVYQEDVLSSFIAQVTSQRD